MTLIEAVEKGKLFRQRSWTHNDWMFINGKGNSAYGGGELMWASSKTRCYIAYADQILGNDWIIIDSDDVKKAMKDAEKYRI